MCIIVFHFFGAHFRLAILVNPRRNAQAGRFPRPDPAFPSPIKYNYCTLDEYAVNKSFPFVKVLIEKVKIHG